MAENTDRFVAQSDTPREVKGSDVTELSEPNRKHDKDEKNTMELDKPQVMDTGWAWVILTACFVNRMLNDGLSSSVGVFLVVWQDQFPGSIAQLSWITALLTGVMHIIGPIGSALLKIFSIRQVVMAGTILTSISFITASFSTSLWHLYVTSALAGLGLGLSFQPSIVILTYYFDIRLARANGVAYAGVAVGVFALPPFLQLLIDQFGWQGALLILASLLGNMCACAATYRPTPLELESRTHEKTQSQVHYFEQKRVTDKLSNDKPNSCTNCFVSCLEAFDFNLLKNVGFVLLLLAHFLNGIAYVVAIHYLPARAVHSGIPDIKAAFLVSVLGMCSFVARVTHGYIIDYQIMSATVLTAIAYFVFGVSTAVNPATDYYAGLVTLSAVAGLSSGVCFAAVPVVAKEYVGVQHVSGAVGFSLLMQGTGVLLGSYIAGVLVDATGSFDIPFYVAGTCFLLCSLLIFAHPLIQYLRPQDDDVIQPKRNGLHGHDNLTMEVETSTTKI